MIKSVIKKLFIFSAIALVIFTYIYVSELLNFKNILTKVQFTEFITGKYEQSFSTYLEEIKMQFIKRNELSDIDSINIIIDNRELESLSSDMPDSGREYKKAKMIINDQESFKVSIRQRGTTQHHWLMRKKSLKIKLKDAKDAKKTDLFRGKQIELLAPKTMYTIGDYLSMFWADKLNLMIPKYKYVNLFINGEFEGLFQVTESINKDFLTSRGLPLGGVFEGENIGLSAKEGIIGSVFSHPFIWENEVENPNEDEHATMLYNLLIGINDEDLQTVYSLIDYDYFVRLLAFVYLNQSMHFDDSHNTKFYYNSDAQAFQQIIWDMNFLGSYYNGEAPKFFVSNGFHRLLLRDPRFVNDVYKELYNLIQSGAVDKFMSVYQDTTEKLRASKEKDSYVVGALSVDKWPQAKNDITILSNDLKKLIDSIETPGICIQRVNNKLQINLSGEVAFYLGSDLLFPGRELSKETNGAITVTFIKPATLSYYYDFTGNSKLKFKNSITGKDIMVGISESCNTNDSNFSFNPSDLTDYVYKNSKIQKVRSNYPNFTYSNSSVTIPAGNHTINQNIVIPAGITTYISPSTTLTMAPDVSFLSKGKVIANGTANAPINVIAKDKNNPFGVFALYGEGSNGSSFDYFNIENGNEDIVEGRYFSGMLSVYHVSDVIVNHSKFQYAHADDALNFKYSNSSVKNSYFYKNSADAIDYDFMSGEISNNKFEENGNDSVDTSGSTTKIQNNSIFKSGDKCISLGEETTAFVYNNLLDGCNIGIEVKDSSRPTILNNTIINNDMGINSYQKKEMFGSAHPKIRNTLFYNNKEEITFKNTFKGTKLDSDNSEIDIKFSNIPGGYKGKGNVDVKIDEGQLWINKDDNHIGIIGN